MLNVITQRQHFDRYLVESEETKLLKHLRSLSSVLARRDLAWIELLRNTGIRIGTLPKLTVRDAMTWLTTERVTLGDSVSKGGRGYELPLNKRGKRAIELLLKVRREQGFAQIPDEPLIMSRNKRALTVRSFQLRIKHWCQEAGLKVDATPHWLRHTFAKRIMSRSTARDPQGIVQAALGQRSRESTVIYTMCDRDELALALEEAS